MSAASKLKPGERDPNRPAGLPILIVGALFLGTLMYVLFPGHGPIQGHVSAPAASASKG